LYFQGLFSFTEISKKRLVSLQIEVRGDENGASFISANKYIRSSKIVMREGIEKRKKDGSVIWLMVQGCYDDKLLERQILETISEGTNEGRGLEDKKMKCDRPSVQRSPFFVFVLVTFWSLLRFILVPLMIFMQLRA